MDRTPLIIGIVLVGTLAIAGVWDVWVIVGADERLTVSEVLRGWFTAFPPLALAAGVLLGHLVWPGIKHQ